MALTITTAAQTANRLPGMKSWSPGLTDFQRAQLRAHEATTAGGGQLQPFGAGNFMSNTQQRARAMGGTYTPGPMGNGMGAPIGMASALGGTAAVGGNVAPGGPAGMPPQQPQSIQSQYQAPGGPLPQNPTGQYSGQQGQGAPMSGMPTNQNAPQGQGYTYRGIGPEGNSVFQDPATGEIFTYPASQGEGLTPGQATGLPQPQTPQTGLIGSEQALRQGLQGGTRAIDAALQQGRGDIQSGLQGATGTLSAYSQPGQGANQYQAALAGALGEQAQQDAMDRFMGSPGQQYLLDESERAIRRNAAATGGLGGANVQRALQENAIGLAAQDFDNAFNRLGSISDRGLASSGQIAGNQFAAGNALAGLTQDAGNIAAQMAYGTGNNLAQGRTRAGEMIAGNLDSTSSNLAQMMYGQGRDMSNVIGSGGSDLARLLAGAGEQTFNAESGLAQLLAQISQNAGANAAGLPGLGGTGQNPGVLTGAGNFLGGLGGFGTDVGWW
jgi:hypothetical protein